MAFEEPPEEEAAVCREAGFWEASLVGTTAHAGGSEERKRKEIGSARGATSGTSTRGHERGLEVLEEEVSHMRGSRPEVPEEDGVLCDGRTSQTGSKKRRRFRF